MAAPAMAEPMRANLIFLLRMMLNSAKKKATIIPAAIRASTLSLV